MARGFSYSTGLIKPTVDLPAASLSSFMGVIIPPQSGVAADVPLNIVCSPSQYNYVGNVSFHACYAYMTYSRQCLEPIQTHPDMLSQLD